MRVQNIDCNNISNKGFYRTVYKTDLSQGVIHKNNTMLFRSDIDWISLVRFLAYKYADIEKVSVYNYACSNGAEPYTLLMSMFSSLEENEYGKFLPILARDYDEFVINVAKKKIIDVNIEEKTNVNLFTRNKFEDYFHKMSKIHDKYTPDNILTSNIDFAVSDITKDYVNLPRENVVLLVRNFWPYLNREYQISLPRELCYHFDKNATIVIGSFDFATQEYSNFLENGFKRAHVKGFGAVFTK